MLSLSAELSQTSVDIRLIDSGATEADGGGVSFAGELVRFAEALVSRDPGSLNEARASLLHVAGPEVLVEAAAVAANFQRMVRIADATGIPVDADRLARLQPAIDQLNLRRFQSATRTPEPSLWERVLHPVRRALVQRAIRRRDRRVNSR